MSDKRLRSAVWPRPCQSSSIPNGKVLIWII